MITFLSIQAVLIQYIRTLDGIAGAGVGTGDLKQLPYVRVVRIGGSDDAETDTARVDIHVFASTQDEAERVSDQIRGFLREMVRQNFNGRYVDRVTTESAPAWQDYQNENIQRYVATYQIESRVGGSW